MFNVPLNGRLDCFSCRYKLEARQVLAKLGIARSLLKLPVRLVGEELHLPLELKGLEDHLSHLLDAHLVGLVCGEDDGIHLLILPQHPDKQSGQVKAVDELPKG